MNTHVNLAEGKLLPVLLKFTFPILLSLLLQITYGMVDLLIVGRFAHIGDVSGVTVGSQIMHTITALCAGLSMGTTILLGQYIGAHKYRRATRVVGVSIVLFTIISIAISCVLLLYNTQIALFMKTPAESFEKAVSYLFISGFGAMCIVFYNLLGAIFRGIGDAKTPLITVLIACIINILLDLFFIAVLDMGASGAALATVIAQASSVLLSLYIIRNRTLPFTFSFKDIGYNATYAKHILRLGVPIALQGVLVSISFLILTAIINTFGVVASAAVGIVEKIAAVIMLVPFAFMQSLSAFTAQNFGAGQHQRAKQALQYAIGLSLAFGSVTTYLAIFHGVIFTQLFTYDVHVTSAALLYLKSYAVDVLFVSIMFSMNGYFNGYGRTTFVMCHSIFGAFCIRVPFAYIFSNLENTSLFIIGLATPASTVVQIVLCIVYYVYFQKYLRTTQMSLKPQKTV